MPWQSMASLGVIIAMFNVVPALNTGVQYLGYGVSGRTYLCVPIVGNRNIAGNGGWVLYIEEYNV